MEIEEIKDKLEKATIAVATANKNCEPHNIAVMYAKIKENKIIITDNFMKISIKNIKANPKISLVFWENEIGYRIDGKAEYHSSGKWLEFVKSLPENKSYKPKGAIIINVESVNELG